MQRTVFLHYLHQLSIYSIRFNNEQYNCNFVQQEEKNKIKTLKTEVILRIGSKSR